MGQLEMEAWWKRHGDLDLCGYTKREIEDLTGCVPLLLTDISKNGNSIDMEAPIITQVAEQVQGFVDDMWKEFKSDAHQWGR